MQQQYRYRRNNAREINLAEDVGILAERARRSEENIREKTPQCNPGEIKEERRHTLRFKADYLIEYQHVRKHGKNRLYYHPQRPQKGLLVVHQKFFSHQPDQQIAE